MTPTTSAKRSSLKRLAFAAIAAAALGGALGLASCDRGGGGATAVGGDIVLGDPKAPVTLIEYASTTCIHCAEFHKEVFPAIKANYIDTGKVKYILREFPTPPAEVSVALFMVARCASKGEPVKYYNMIGAIFERQPQIFTALQGGRIKDELLSIARQSGMSEDAFEPCIRNADEIKRINTVTENGSQKFGIQATPSLIIDDKLVDSKGLTKYTPEFVSAKLDEALK
jgi:protein-disulfide isomerase